MIQCNDRVHKFTFQIITEVVLLWKIFFKWNFTDKLQIELEISSIDHFFQLFTCYHSEFSPYNGHSKILYCIAWIFDAFLPATYAGFGVVFTYILGIVYPDRSSRLATTAAQPCCCRCWSWTSFSQASSSSLSTSWICYREKAERNDFLLID
jgi:hypothetical protein